MNKFVVAYDLNKTSDYTELYEVLDSYTNCAKVNESVRIIGTNSSRDEVYNNIEATLSSKDSLFVGALTGSAAWKNVEDGTLVKQILSSK